MGFGWVVCGIDGLVWGHVEGDRFIHQQQTVGLDRRRR